MPTNVCLRSKFPKFAAGDSDGAAAFDGASSEFKANTSGPINGGSHDIEGWFPVENSSVATQKPRIPYTSLTGTTSSTTDIIAYQTGTYAWITWDSQTGVGLRYFAQGSFTGGSVEIYTGPSNGASAKLCDARALQTWDLNFHAYSTQASKNFSVWIFFLNSSHNYVGSTFSTPDATNWMNDSTESEGHARGINTGSNNYGHTSRYNDTYTSSNPYYDNGSSGYNFRLVPIVDTDYHFYQIFFQIPNNTDIRGLGFRMDMDSDGHTVQLDEICLRPMNVRMSKTYTASALSNISLDDIVNA